MCILSIKVPIRKKPGNFFEQPLYIFVGWVYGISTFVGYLGITGCSLKVASNRLQTAVQYASSWIWLKVRSFQHE